MRIITFIAVLMCVVARSNPTVLTVPASDRVYMSSEHLTAVISPDEAQLTGSFTFHYRADVPAPGQKSYVVLEIPIWFPEERFKDASVGEFWKTFPKDADTEVAPTNRMEFEKATGLQVSLGGRPLSLIRLDLLLTNSVVMTVPWEWHQEPGFCCMVFSFCPDDDVALTQKQLTISYRQPLLKANGTGRFYYLPDFKNLPKGTGTADLNMYSVTILAAPDCTLTVSDGNQKSDVEAGHAIRVSPRHQQPIRVVVTKQPNTARGCVKSFFAE
jgi:hypothetical protein